MDGDRSTPHLDGRRVLGIFVLALVVAAVAVPRRLWPVLPAIVVSGFVLSAVLAWGREIGTPEAFSLADQGNRPGSTTPFRPARASTKLYASPLRCPYTELTRHALFLTEFFNGSVDRAASIGDSTPDGLPTERVDIGTRRRLLLSSGRPLVARYVVTQPWIELRGRRLASGTGAGLVLWQTRGPVALAGRFVGCSRD